MPYTSTSVLQRVSKAYSAETLAAADGSAPGVNDVRRTTDNIAGGPAAERANAHFYRALGSYSRPLPLRRTLTDAEVGGSHTARGRGRARAPSSALLGGLPPIVYAEFDRSPVLRSLTVPNCHDGQRKLSLALLEFLATALRTLQCTQEDILLVYAGASGLASVIAFTAFPHVRQVLFDPATNIVTHMPRGFKEARVFADTYRVPLTDLAAGGSAATPLTIFTGSAGWFDDAAAAYCCQVLLPALGKRHLLFASDVRADTGELDIARDMQSQMRWTMIANAAMYMHKFRVPYADVPEAEQTYALYRSGFANAPLSRLMPSVRAFAKQSAASLPHGMFPYLDGDLYVQVNAHPRTAELRLIGAKRKTGFKHRVFSAHAIEDAMATFNTVYRMHARYAYPPGTHPPLRGELPNTYDIVSEHAIVALCAYTTAGNPSTGRSNATSLHARINAILERFNSKNLLTCPFVSASVQHRKKNVPIPDYMHEWALQVAAVVPDFTFAAPPNDDARQKQRRR